MIGLFALAASVSFGQIRRGNNVIIQPQIGIFGGLSVSNQWESNDGYSQSDDAIAGGIAGIQLALPISYGWYIQPEVTYTNMGTKYYQDASSDDDYGGGVKLRMNYLNVPILFKYQEPFTGVGIFFGPQYGYLLSAHTYPTSYPKPDITSVDVKDGYHKNELSGLVGLEYYFPNNGRPGPKFGFSARYQFGITNVLNNDYYQTDGSIRNNAFFLTAGIRF
ncbi:MAG: porin family protein [Arachidicoccus sp.]|nr:porin family protein [Arachidicoccus sp.]